MGGSNPQYRPKHVFCPYFHGAAKPDTEKSSGVWLLRSFMNNFIIVSFPALVKRFCSNCLS